MLFVPSQQIKDKPHIYASLPGLLIGFQQHACFRLTVNSYCCIVIPLFTKTAEKQRLHITGNGSKTTTTMAQRKGVGGNICGLIIKLSYLWILPWNIKVIKCKKLPSGACSPQCSGRVVLFTLMWKTLLVKLKLALSWLYASFTTVAWMIRSHKQVSHTKDNVRQETSQIKKQFLL